MPAKRSRSTSSVHHSPTTSTVRATEQAKSEKVGMTCVLKVVARDWLALCKRTRSPAMFHAIVRRRVRHVFARLSAGDFQPMVDSLASRFSYRFEGDSPIAGVRTTRE